MKSTLEEQQAFVTVVDSGSITNAAERLGITVSGVSRALNRLEQSSAPRYYAEPHAAWNLPKRVKRF